jgi:AcrR family transcriptional regulator
MTGFLLSRVANEAGVSISLVSHYFGSADELFMAVIQSTVTEEKPRKIKRAENWKDAQDNLRTLISSFFDEDIFSRESLLIDLAIFEQSLLDAGIRRSLRGIQRKRHARVAAILADMAYFQGTSIDPELLADEFLALVEGLKLKWCLSGRHSTTQVADVVTRFLNGRLG